MGGGATPPSAAGGGGPPAGPSPADFLSSSFLFLFSCEVSSEENAGTAE